MKPPFSINNNMLNKIVDISKVIVSTAGSCKL